MIMDVLKDDDAELLIPVNENPEKMTVDDALTATGGYKWFQVIMQSTIGYFLLVFAYQILLLYFTADDPPWRCTQNATSSFCLSHPKTYISVESPLFDERCKIPRSDWEYQEKKEYSLVTEFDLVCSQESMKSLVTGMFYIGWGVAGIFVGVIADYMGRKPVLFLSTLILVGSSIGSVYVESIWEILLGRFLIGAAYGAMNTCAYILLSEFIAIKHKSLSGNIYQLPSTISLYLLIGLAYLTREWRKLTLYISVPGILAVIISYFLPESPRWMVTSDYKLKARNLLKKIGKINNSPLNENFELIVSGNTNSKQSKYSYIDLFRKLKVAITVLILAFAWFAAGVVFFGLSYEASGLGSNIYMDLSLLTLVDIPATIFCWVSSNKYGRKKTTILSFLVCGVSLLIISAIPSGTQAGKILRLVFALNGKCFASVAFNTIYVWSVEVYPTVVRSQGFTICQIAARIGSTSAPFVSTNLRSVYMQLPYIVLGVIGLISGLFCFYLPETNKKPTREKFADFFDGYDAHHENTESA